MEALKLSGTARLKTGAWNTLIDSKGKEHRFRKTEWAEKMKSDGDFRQAVYDIMDEEVIRKFDSEGKNFGIEEESES